MRKEKGDTAAKRASWRKTTLSLFAAVFMITAVAAFVLSSAPADDGNDAALGSGPGHEFSFVGVDGNELLYKVNGADDGVMVIGYVSLVNEDLIIPGIVEDDSSPAIEYPVIGVGDDAFINNHFLESVTFEAPEDIELIGDQAFHACVNLAVIDLSGCVNLEEIGFRAFRDTAIEEIDLSNTLLTSIPAEAFWGCLELKDVYLSPNITELGTGAFFYCIALENIDLRMIKDLGAIAFYGCESLKSVNLSSLKSIGPAAFGGNATHPVAIDTAILPLGLDLEVMGDLDTIDGGAYAGEFTVKDRDPEILLNSDVKFFVSGPAYMVTFSVGSNGIVIYEVDGAQYVATDGVMFVAIGEDVTITPIPFEGYKFDWDSGVTAVGGSLTLTVAGDIDVVIGDFAPVEYTITYVGVGGATTPTKTTYTIEEAVTFATTLTWSGYIFDGWFNDEGRTVSTTGITLGTTGNVMVFAKWNLDVYTLDYDLLDGGSVSQAVFDNLPDEYTIEDNFLLGIPTRDGYTFLGWYTSFVSDVYSDPITGITPGMFGNLTVYAEWEVITYTITYEVFDTAASPVDFDDLPDEYTIEDDIVLGIPERYGYTFVGWFFEDDFSGSAVQDFFAGDYFEDLVFYAKWDMIVFEIEYDLLVDAGSASQAIFDNLPDEFTVEDDVAFGIPERFGYVFGGWFFDDDLLDPAGDGFLAGGTNLDDLTLYAMWTIIEYEINYENVPADVDTSDWPVSYTVEDASPIVLPAGVVANGFGFIQWYEKDDLTRAIVADFAVVVLDLDDKTFVAAWEVLDVSVSIVTSGYKDAPVFKYWISPLEDGAVYNGSAIIGVWTEISGDQVILVPFGSTLMLMSISDGKYNFCWVSVGWPDVPVPDYPNCGCLCADCALADDCDGSECDTNCECLHCIPLEVPAPEPGAMIVIVLDRAGLTESGFELVITGEYEHIDGYSYAYLIVALAVIGVIGVFAALSISARKS
ncbi:MAG: leucine-rich repeat protein [Methanomassiliicoccaceae archaeon]|nr:leucine-rich repeat protein [Methanomassiliicoccaceae archaeon]